MYGYNENKENKILRNKKKVDKSFTNTEIWDHPTPPSPTRRLNHPTPTHSVQT